MNEIIQKYINRFKTEKSNSLGKFFTQLEMTNYLEELPFLYEIEFFCIRLLKALILEEKICIYSDYDTDAVTATATCYWGLLDLGFKKEKLSFYAPDRFTEGYGMNVEAVKELARNNKLIISVDCGINSTEEAKAIKNTSCDLIITDHHHLNGDLPDCLAVINPQVAKYYLENNLNYKETSDVISNQLDKYKSEILTWLEKVKLVRNNPKNLLSTSTTGVGVIWFSLVWLAYFLEDIGLENYSQPTI